MAGLRLTSSSHNVNLWIVPLKMSLAAIVLFAITITPDMLAAYHVIHLPNWFTMGGIDASVDSEGGAKAGSDKNKYLAPLALGVLAAASMDGDEASDVFKNGVVSNGFGLVARVVTMAASNRGLAQGFAYFALSKSIYKRWIAKGARGHFPKGHTP